MIAPAHRRNILPWIIAFKAFKCLTLTALGVTLLVIRRGDPLTLIVRLALAIHLPITSRLFERVLEAIAQITVDRYTSLAITAFAYAALMGMEGIGLYFRKPWARWFTIVATGSLIPLEVYEVVRKVHFVRALILAVNIAVVVYLYRRRELFEDNP